MLKVRCPLATLGMVLVCSQSEAQAPIADVPFVLHQNAIIVKVVANDRDTLNLLLDTGWGSVALTDSAISRLRIGSPQISESNGWITVGSITIRGLRKTAIPVEVFRAGDLTPLIGPHDGVLATAFFNDLVLQVDYPRSRLRFFARSPFEGQESGAGTLRRSTLPMTFSSNAGSLPFSDSVFVNGRAARGLFDTGGAGAFVAMEKLITAQRLDQSLDSTIARIGFLDGSPRQATVRFARLRSVQLGQFVVDAPRVLLAPPQLAGGNWGHDLVIGYGFMRHYVVTFDYPGRRITLER